jgi:hypothetical protein
MHCGSQSGENAADTRSNVVDYRGVDPWCCRGTPSHLTISRFAHWSGNLELNPPRWRQSVSQSVSHQTGRGCPHFYPVYPVWQSYTHTGPGVLSNGTTTMASRWSHFPDRFSQCNGQGTWKSTQPSTMAGLSRWRVAAVVASVASMCGTSTAQSKRTVVFLPPFQRRRSWQWTRCTCWIVCGGHITKWPVASGQRVVQTHTMVYEM